MYTQSTELYKEIISLKTKLSNKITVLEDQKQDNQNLITTRRILTEQLNNGWHIESSKKTNK